MKTRFALCTLLVLFVASVSAQDYAIKILQPLKVGQRYNLTVVASDSSEMTMTSEKRTPKSQKEERNIEMESTATVLAVDANGRPTKESHTIVKLLQGDAKEPLLVAGTKVLATRSGRKRVFEIEGVPVMGAAAKALDLGVNITSGGPTDDEMFGTTERKKVGDSWPMNQTVAMKETNERLGAMGMGVASIKGTTALQKVTRDGDVNVLHFKSTLNATASPAGKSPFTSADTTMDATFIEAVPEDMTRSLLEEGFTTTMTMKASRKPNPEGLVVQISMKAKRSITRKYKLLN